MALLAALMCKWPHIKPRCGGLAPHSSSFPSNSWQADPEKTLDQFTLHWLRYVLRLLPAIKGANSSVQD